MSAGTRTLCAQRRFAADRRVGGRGGGSTDSIWYRKSVQISCRSPRSAEGNISDSECCEGAQLRCLETFCPLASRDPAAIMHGLVVYRQVAGKAWWDVLFRTATSTFKVALYTELTSRLIPSLSAVRLMSVQFL